jgi:REP element-mobilizing transposase RayT
MRKIPFANEEIYHVYNRGTDKRTIFEDPYDFQRFLQSLEEFNTLDPIGSIYEHSFVKTHELGHSMSKSEDGLVEIIAYCLNPNHFHLLLRQVSENGISKFMQRVGNGYTKYFNHKNERSGSLFQGTFKAIHVDSNEYLLHLSVYVNLNNEVHKLGHQMSKSSWGEYTRKIQKGEVGLCEKEVILGQFQDTQEYQRFAQNTLKGIQEKRLLQNEQF